MQLLAQTVYQTSNSLPAAGGFVRILIMSLACLLVLFISSRTIQKPHVGARMPLGPLSGLFNDISIAGFIGAMSFGHILGTLGILAASQGAF